jgi:hypothetical protein
VRVCGQLRVNQSGILLDWLAAIPLAVLQRSVPRGPFVHRRAFVRHGHDRSPLKGERPAAAAVPAGSADCSGGQRNRHRFPHSPLRRAGWPPRPVRATTPSATQQELATSLSTTASHHAGIAGALRLYRRTWHRAVRTKHAAIAGLRSKLHSAASTFIGNLTRVSRHTFCFGSAASGAGDNGLIDHGRPYREQTCRR